jgi:hypothetical protein
MDSSSAAGLLGAAAQGSAKDSGSTPRWRAPGSRMFSTNAAEMRPPEVVMWVEVAIGSHPEIARFKQVCGVLPQSSPGIR